jgi:hypothetical protein
MTMTPVKEDQNERRLKRTMYFVVECLAKQDTKLLLNTMRLHSALRIISDDMFDLDPSMSVHARTRLFRASRNLIQNKTNIPNILDVLILQYCYPTHDFLLDPEMQVLLNIQGDNHKKVWSNSVQQKMKFFQVYGLSPHFPFVLQCAIRYALEWFMQQPNKESLVKDLVPNPMFSIKDNSIPVTRLEYVGFHIRAGIITNKYISKTKYGINDSKDYSREVIKYLQDRLKYWRRKTTFNKVLRKPEVDSEYIEMVDSGMLNEAQITLLMADIYKHFPVLSQMTPKKDNTAFPLKFPFICIRAEAITQEELKILQDNFPEGYHLYHLQSINKTVHFFFDTYHWRPKTGLQTKRVEVGADRDACLIFCLMHLLRDIHQHYPEFRIADRDFAGYEIMRQFVLTGEPREAYVNGTLARNFFSDLLKKNNRITDEEYRTIRYTNEYQISDRAHVFLEIFGLDSHEIVHIAASASDVWVASMYKILMRIDQSYFNPMTQQWECKFPDMLYEDEFYNKVADYCLSANLDIHRTLMAMGFKGYESDDISIYYYVNKVYGCLSEQACRHCILDPLTPDHIETRHQQFQTCIDHLYTFKPPADRDFDQQVDLMCKQYSISSTHS